MSQHIHEELEVGQHLDQAARSAITGVAQLVERLARSHAERDRAAAQAMRDHMYAQRTREQSRPDPRRPAPRLPMKDAGGPAAVPFRDDAVRQRVRDLLDQAEREGLSGVGQTARAWEGAMIDISQRPTDQQARDVAASLERMGRAQHGASFCAAVEELFEENQRRDEQRRDAAQAQRAESAQTQERERDEDERAEQDRRDGEENGPRDESVDREVEVVERIERGEEASTRSEDESGLTHEQSGPSPVERRRERGDDVEAAVLAAASGVVLAAEAQLEEAAHEHAVAQQTALESTLDATRDAAGPVVEATPVVLPAFKANGDRGVKPTTAATPEEAIHRQQTWDLARKQWLSEHPELTTRAAQDAAWRAMDIKEKTPLYWKQYDTLAARTVTPSAPKPAPKPEAVRSAEFGVSAKKAPNAAEAEHRRTAWRMAEREWMSEKTGAGMSSSEARKAWRDLEWPDKLLRYTTAYENPASLAVAPSTATPGPASDAAAVTKTATAGTAGRTAPDGGVQISRDRVVALNTMAAQYFAYQATPGSKGRDYLQDRLGADTLASGQWQLGYAPDSWTGLTDHLRRQGASNDEIVAAGLGRVSSRGAVIDAFRDRAMIGIRDEKGDVVGFVGRDLSESATAPKYLNTGATAAFRKGDHVLGLSEAPATARLVRVEGPFDAIAVTAAGQGRYAGVAPLGTAMTDVQADKIAEHARSSHPAGSPRVWEALDGDLPGQKATSEDYWKLADRGIDARLIPLPKNQDPAQLWHDAPDVLRTYLDVADAAPTAAVVVVDRAIAEAAKDLTAGDEQAVEELAALRDQLDAQLSPADRGTVDRRATSALDQLDTPTETTSTTPVDQAGATQFDQADTGRGESRTAALSSLDEVANGQVTTAVYDRGATAALVNDVEAAEARRVSGAGFSRPTADMLTAAANERATPARAQRAATGRLEQGRRQSL